MLKEHPMRQLMLQAIELSRQAFGRAAPNPCVGALIVRENTVLAQGWHDACGGPHAERMALAEAAAKGLDLSDCTMLVTLEPCNHYGRTSPCTEAILESGIKHVVVGTRDPNPRAAGGIERLRAAGLKVEVGVAEQECLDNIRDFLHFQSGEKRPYLILKLASTLDGRIATRNGHSQWISSPASLKKVHWLRSRVQAVMVGSGTFFQDNPRLTARGDFIDCGPLVQPLAVVLTSSLPAIENKKHFNLLRERAESTIFFTTQQEAAGEKARQLRADGVFVHAVAHSQSGLSFAEISEVLWQEHACRYVLCEGGGKLGLELLRQEQADELLLFLAPKILGDNQASPLFDGLTPHTMDEALQLRLAGSFMSGSDIGLRFLRN